MVIVNNAGKRNVERMCGNMSVSTLNHLSDTEQLYYLICFNI